MGLKTPKKPDTLQGSLDLLILKTLEREPNHGFGITLHIQTASDGALLIEEGSLYPALHRLEREHLIAGEWKTTDNGRRARYYRLTAAGSKRFSEVEESWRVLTKSVAKVLRYV
jgi:PadR family transcriptional regulator PadR